VLITDVYPVPALVSDIAEIDPTAEYGELPYPLPDPVMIKLAESSV
jgi:hypothetical protein